MERITYTNDEGGISIVTPTQEVLDAGWTMKQVAEHSVPAGKEWHIVPLETIPTDRRFRNAWRKDESKVAIDKDHAIELHLNAIRAKRNAALDQLDKDQVRAADQGKDKDVTDIRATKQTLRDLPATVEAQAQLLDHTDVAAFSAALAALEPEIA